MLVTVENNNVRIILDSAYQLHMPLPAALEYLTAHPIYESAQVEVTMKSESCEAAANALADTIRKSQQWAHTILRTLAAYLEVTGAPVKAVGIFKENCRLLISGRCPPIIDAADFIDSLGGKGGKGGVKKT